MIVDDDNGGTVSFRGGQVTVMGRKELQPVRYYSLTCETNAEEYFSNEGPDWMFCKEHATFVHKDKDACEFILHIGTNDVSSEAYKDTIAKMHEWPCSREFMDLYKEAALSGAHRLLLYV